MKKVIITILVSCFIFINISFSQENTGCKVPPIKDAQHAICYGKWHARKISDISAYGYKYYAERSGNEWVIRIVEQNPTKDSIYIKIKEHDGSLIEMKKGT